MTRLSSYFRTLVMAVLAPLGSGAAGAAEVDVFAEGTITDDNVVVEVFANAPDVSLYSFGIRIDYNAGQVEPADAATNGSEWYFGDGNNNEPYEGARLLVEQSRVLLIGGKLDIDSPQAGSGGDRMPLGTVTFTKQQSGTPDLTLGLARTEESFANFVTTDGRVLDDIDDGLSFGTVEFGSDSNDSDEDGLPDDWEEEHFGDLAQDGEGNPDGDRLNNEEEMIAGTDPQSSGSVFTLQVEAVPEGLRLRWESVADRVYTIRVSEAPSQSFETLEDGIEATPPENTHVVPINDGDAPRFYRIGVRRAQQ